MRDDDSLWYKDAVFYEVHVRAFQDSDGDGIGDFRGLTRRLDYLHDLGVTAIWLLPFYPSPLRDDGYDIADYSGIHDNYGTIKDFQLFLDEAHRRGLRVVTELVLNHTSDQHPWFQRARRSPPGSPERDFYVWAEAPSTADVPERFREARIIFQDFERSNWSWDSVARAYYWHRFYSHQPDLNYDNPAVIEAMFKTVDAWLEMGVDGLRLDAVPYLFEREGTNCENLPETYEFLKRLRRHIDERFPNRMLLAEANQWPEDTAAYFGAGDACQMAFHFPLMPRMFMAIHMEDRLPIVDILAQTPEIHETCQWAIFLRNHDELTLEMVTDEERDYMNRVYAREAQARINLGIRRRLAPLLRNNRRRIELMNALLLSLPGTPVIYYGDEIGMGDNIYLGDRNGVRTPMQWSPDRNAGFSRGNPQSLYLPVIIDPEYHYETVNVESQVENPHSLLSWMKRIIALRKRSRAFGQGSLELLQPDNDRILGFLRRFEDETILVLANLSRFVQPVELDLSPFQGLRPVEMFGRIAFPVIGEAPYMLTMGPHAFYWFSLEPLHSGAGEIRGGRDADHLPNVRGAGAWEELVIGENRAAIEGVLRTYLERRSFGGDRRPVRFVEIGEVVPLRGSSPAPMILLVDVEYYQGQPARFQIPLALASGDQADGIRERHPESAIAILRGDIDGLLFDGMADDGFCHSLLSEIAQGEPLGGRLGQIEPEPAADFQPIEEEQAQALAVVPIDGRWTNTSVAFGDRFVLKVFRRVEEGMNPDVELHRFLSEAVGFPHVSRFAGSLRYRHGRSKPTALALLQDYVPNRGTAWDSTREALGHYYDRVLGRKGGREVSSPRLPLLDLSGLEIPGQARETIGPYLDQVRRIGQRTGELHKALASRPDLPDFAPETFSSLYQRSLYQSMRGQARRAVRRLVHRLEELPEEVQEDARSVIKRQEEILDRFQAILRRKIAALKIRVHGDYHLGQLLHSGSDYVIHDFEGHAFRPLTERRIKRSPLHDVAGMLNSIQYAAFASLQEQETEEAGKPSILRREDMALLEPWSRFWVTWVSAAFLRDYLKSVQDLDLLPRDPEGLRVLCEAFQLDRAIESLAYEIDHRPGWVGIPLRAILTMLDTPIEAPEGG